MVRLSQRNPTVDLYFGLPMHGLVTRLPWPFGGRPIRQIGPSTFVCNGRGVIIRYARHGELDALERLAPHGCAYLIDDDLPAALEDDRLPEDYRRRLEAFMQDEWRRIRDMSECIVAPNERIFAAYPDRMHRRVDPAALCVAPDLRHFDETDRLLLAFTGSRSHLADLEDMASVLADICRRHPRVRLITFLGKHAPAELQGLPNVRHLPPQPWSRFRRRMCRLRFHLALAPMRPTAFNLARSINKLHDHAAFGAAGLYPDFPIFREALTDGVEGLLLPWDPEAWHVALDALIRDRPRMRNLAAAGLALARRTGDPTRLRRWWLEWFALDAGA